jgi:hypothetical protein
MGGEGGSVPCSLPASPCADDGNPCTVEACTNGFCTSIPLTLAMGPGSTECMTIACMNGALTTATHDGSQCGMGLKCVGKVCTGCAMNEDCGKTDECQTPTCLSDKTCDSGYKPIGTPVIPPLPSDQLGDCMATICNGSGAIVLFVDDTDVPPDLLCNDGHCVNGAPVQTPSALGAPCKGGKTFCDASQKCVECATDANCTAPGATCYQQSGCVSCTDGVQNGDEVATDCGGASCLACTGSTCVAPNDCALGHCNNTVCCGVECVGPCKSCNLPMKAGTCLDSPLGFGDPACPAASPVCQAGICVNDVGKNHLGEPCMLNADCFSFNCQGITKTCK